MTEVAAPLAGRERLIRAGYELFTRHGTRVVGVDMVSAAAGVAKMTLYRNFASKADLILAVLGRRERLWTRQWLLAEVARRASSPGGQLLAVFDVLATWFERPDFEGCTFLRTMVEVTDRADPVRQASVAHLGEVRRALADMAAAAGVERPDALAHQWHILVTGAIMAAESGDRHAAREARGLGRLLLHHYGVTPEQSAAGPW